MKRLTFGASFLLALHVLGHVRGDDGPTPPVRHATPVNWFGKFKPASMKLLAGTGDPAVTRGLYSLVALTNEATPRLILQTPHVRPGRPTADAELWAADLDGGRPVLLADERGRALFQFEPAPGSARVAYVTGPPGRSDVEALRQSTLRLAEPGRPPRTVADGGVQAPGWTPDGGTLLFLRAVEGGWQACRADGDEGPVTLAAGVFSQPGDWREPAARFSPDGRSAAGVQREKSGGDRFRVVDLASGRARDLNQVTGQVTAVRWSPDSAWVYTHALVGTRMATFDEDLAIEVATGKATSLNGRLDVLAPPAAGDVIVVAAAGWLPGARHRLLLLLKARRGPGDLVRRGPGAAPPRETRWLVRDLDDRSSVEVTGLPTRLDPGDSARLSFTTDGRHVLGLDALSVLDGPP